jgi:ABC-2 type transport system permease protein
MRELRLLGGQIRYQLLLLGRTPRAIFAGLVFPLVLLVLRGKHPTASLVAGLAVLGVLSTAYLTHAAGLVAAREDGVLRRWRATPLPRWCFFAGRILATVVLAMVAAAVTVTVAVAMYGVRVDVRAGIGLTGAIVLGALAFSAVGTAATVLVPSAESAQPLLSLTFYPVALLSGIFGSTGSLPHWVDTVVRYLPVWPVVDAATHALSRHSEIAPVGDLAVLAGWLVAGLIASLAFFRWDPN